MRRPAGLAGGLTFWFVLLASTPAVAVTPSMNVTPGQSLTVPASSGFEVITSCGPNNTIGPTGTSYQIAPSDAAATLSGIDTSKVLAPSGTIAIKVSPSVSPGVSITVS